MPPLPPTHAAIRSRPLVTRCTSRCMGAARQALDLVNQMYQLIGTVERVTVRIAELSFYLGAFGCADL